MASESKKPRRTQAERREEARGAIIEATIRLVASKGYDRFTFADVGEVSGYSRGIVSHYFASKDALIAETVGVMGDRYLTWLTPKEDSERGLPRLERLFKRYASIVGDPDTRGLSVLLGEAILKPDLAETVRQINHRGFRRIRDELNEGKALGQVRPDIDAHDYAKFIYSFLRGMLQFGLLEPNYDAPKVVDDFVADLRKLIS